MFTGYNLVVDKEDKNIDFLQYTKKGEDHLKSQKALFKEKIDEYIIDGISDGTKLERDWFPLIEANIFISHSHIDENLANGIAGWLNEKFGLRCFIDSCVWNYSDDLLEMINSEFSDKRKNQNGGYLYNYKKSNTASKHVNTMLSIALQKMIDKTEVTILLNTGNSIEKYDNVYEKATYSPWIYSEIVCTQIVRRRPLNEYRQVLKFAHENAQISNNEEYKSIYKVSLDHLNNLDITNFMKWKRMYQEKRIDYPLDYLYAITNPIEMKDIAEYNDSHDILLG
ncbi:hypothetical protein FDF26_08975 [Clostridium botulinum]|uniref:toll/interleukin-1 receptor domain-containing protein n=1 Tax=Clostridium cagae TaxID=2080751 RepID=UPI000CF62D40|nr:toll/interleukin-1 receptor domain-containing protein [Clostridium cagae]NFT07197.1 hypothetical protein [Clostridium botulinum]